jgi:hypothetical protein
MPQFELSPMLWRSTPRTRARRKMRRPMRILNAAAALSIMGLIIAGCANEPRIAFTEADQDAAVPAGMPGNIRYWLDEPASVFQNSPSRAVVQKGKPFSYLALSGGGGSGAYGAGILNGWTESGTRPEFTVVSGVSTGPDCAVRVPRSRLRCGLEAGLHKRRGRGPASRS